MDKPVFDLFKEKTNFFELFFFLPLKNQRIHSPPTHAPKIFKTFLCVPIIGYFSEVLCSPAPSYKQNFKVKFCICGPITVQCNLKCVKFFFQNSLHPTLYCSKNSQHGKPFNSTLFYAKLDSYLILLLCSECPSSKLNLRTQCPSSKI